MRPKPKKEGPSPRRKSTKHEERPKPRFSDILPVQISQLAMPISLNCTVRSSCNFDTRCTWMLGLPHQNFRIIQPSKRSEFRSKCALLSAVRFYFFPLLLFSMLHSPPYFHPSHHTIFVAFSPYH